jgi:transposase
MSRLMVIPELEKPALKPLPSTPYQFGLWAKVRANKGYLIFFDEHQYSVPYHLAGEEMYIRCTKNTIEVMHQNIRVASHKRSYDKGGKTILKEHMPESHRQFADWTPEAIKKEAKKIGECTHKLINKIMTNCEHIYKGAKVSLGIIRLKSGYGEKRLEAACKRALIINGFSYKSVESILKKGLDQVELTATERSQIANLSHENVRGGDYFE